MKSLKAQGANPRFRSRRISPFNSLFRTAACAISSAALAFGQTAPTVTSVDGSTPPAVAGGQPAGSYVLSGFETVNAFNGNLNFRLPFQMYNAQIGDAAHLREFFVYPRCIFFQLHRVVPKNFHR